MSSREPLITVINGPNLSKLGEREPDQYGHTTEEELIEMLQDTADGLGLRIRYLQFDGEGELVGAISRSAADSHGLVINPGGYSHYSVAILDSIRMFPGPVVEVHVSQVFAREGFRSRLLTAQAASSVITGAGVRGYTLALELLSEFLSES